MPFRYSIPRMLVEMVRARGDFDRMADHRARRDSAELTATQLLTALRDNVEHPWSPPGGGPLGALSHDVIHGLDVCAALGMHGRASTARVATVLAGMQPKHLAHFAVDLDGVELRATDVDWSHGRGEPVTGTAADLLLLVCGRRVPTGRLIGPGSERFAA